MATTQELLDQLRTDSSGGVRGRCKFAIWLETLDDGALREAIIAASDDDQISGAAIYRLASGKGYVGGSTIAKAHLNGSCTCVRKGAQ